MDISKLPAAALKESASPADTLKEKKLRQACADFEAIILEKMLSSARESIPKSGLIDGGFGEEMYQSMYDFELSKKMAHGKGMGLGELLYKQISQQLSGPRSK